MPHVGLHGAILSGLANPLISISFSSPGTSTQSTDENSACYANTASRRIPRNPLPDSQPLQDTKPSVSTGLGKNSFPLVNQDLIH